MALKLGSVWKNKDPYDGEGEIIIGDPYVSFGLGYYKCIHARHTKYPGLNGSVEIKHEDKIKEFYNKIAD